MVFISNGNHNPNALLRSWKWTRRINVEVGELKSVLLKFGQLTQAYLREQDNEESFQLPPKKARAAENKRVYELNRALVAPQALPAQRSLPRIPPTR